VARARLCEPGSRIFEPGPDPAAASPASAGMLGPKSSPLTTCWSPSSVRAPGLVRAARPRSPGTTRVSTSGSGAPGSPPWRFRRGGAPTASGGGGARQRQAGLACDWRTRTGTRALAAAAAPNCQARSAAPRGRCARPTGADSRACLADAAAWVPPSTRKSRSARDRAGRVTGVVTARGTTPVEHACLAAGVWSPQIHGLPRPCPSSRCGPDGATRGPTTARRDSHHDKATSRARQRRAVSAAPWSGRGTTRGSRTRGSPKFSGGAVRLLPALMTQRCSASWPDSVGHPRRAPILGGTPSGAIMVRDGSWTQRLLLAR